MDSAGHTIGEKLIVEPSWLVNSQIDTSLFKSTCEEGALGI